jgi:hypothetical protein
MATKETKSSPVTVQLQGDYESGKTDKLSAFLIDDGGGLVEAVPFKGNTATFKTPRSGFDGRSKIYINTTFQKDAAGRINERALIKSPINR